MTPFSLERTSEGYSAARGTSRAWRTRVVCREVTLGHGAVGGPNGGSTRSCSSQIAACYDGRDSGTIACSTCVQLQLDRGTRTSAPKPPSTEVHVHSEALGPLSDGEPMKKEATCTVEAIQEDPGALMLRIPPKFAKQAGLRPSQPVWVEATPEGVMIRTTFPPSLTLAKMLDAFDPHLHGGEVMGTRPIGNEAFSTPKGACPKIVALTELRAGGQRRNPSNRTHICVGARPGATVNSVPHLHGCNPSVV